MAGETAVSANSSTGVYLMIDNNGWVAANTPNTCNLGGGTGLVLATGYMYFDKFQSLTINATTPTTDKITGWSIGQDGTTHLKNNAYTGQGKLERVDLQVIATGTQDINFQKFFDLHQATKPGTSGFQLYLVRQLASTTFREFSYNATAKKYLAVVLTDYVSTEASQQGKDVINLNIGMIHAYRLNTG